MDPEAKYLVECLERELSSLPVGWWANLAVLDNRRPERSLYSARICQQVEGYFIATGHEAKWRKGGHRGFWVRKVGDGV